MARTFVPHHISDDSALGGSVIKNSLRFNDNDNAYLSRTPSSAGNRKKWTFSVWIKRGNLGGSAGEQRIFGGNANASHIFFESNDEITWDLANEGSSSAVGNLNTQQKFRDNTSWFHLVCALDTDESTANNRMRMYINGTEITSFGSRTNPSSGYATNAMNNNTLHTLGYRTSGQGSAGMEYDGYMAEINFVDGLQLDASYFGYTDFQTGLWRPKGYFGSYNTNGFHLEFKNTSTAASYTVPTASFTTDSDTQLLINNNESNGSTTFTDSSSNGYSVSGTGGVSHSTAQSKFGTSSIIFDGSDDSLTVGGNSTLYSALTAGSNQTYEGWIWITARDYSWMFSSSSNQQYLGVNIQPAENGSYIAFSGNQPNPYTAIQGNAGGGGKSGSSGDSPSQSWPLNQWIHMFVQRNADGTMMVGADGQVLYQASEGANNTNGGTIGPLKIGSQHYYGSTHRNFFEGYMDELRISNTPRYSASYSGTVGDDTSGMGNSFTPNSFTSSDVLPDVPTNNFATLDVISDSGGTYSEGNLKIVSTADPGSSTLGFASGKFYYEAYINATSNIYVGVMPIDYGLNPARGGNWTHGAIAYRTNGQQYKLKAGGGSSSVSASYGDSYTAGDIIGCAVDIDNDTVTFYKNGTSQGNTSDGVSYITASGTTSVYGAIVYCNGGNNTILVNFGQDSTFQGTVSAGGNKDASGLGDFKYPVPSGYRALCSNNLPVNTTPAILKPEQHFDTVLYTGNGSSNGDVQRISSLQFDPDFVWIKSRSASNHNQVFDIIRSVGSDKALSTNQPIAEYSFSDFDFLNNGFNAPYSSSAAYSCNTNSATYVAWGWKAGGSSNTFNVDGKGYATASAAGLDGGTANPTGASVNTKAGFSIISYTATNNQNVSYSHGLNQAPEIIIAKDRDNSRNWGVYYSVISTNTNWMMLNSTDGVGNNNSGITPVGGFSGSYMTLHQDYFAPAYNAFANGGNDGDDKMIAYMWHSVPGYSKIGSYTGNGNANGPYIECGFRPAWIMIKNTVTGHNWHIYDSTRSTTNPALVTIYANRDLVEENNTSVTPLDILSNGFKLRSTWNDTNQNGSSIIYMAFAEQSGSTAYATETNAR